MQVGPEIVNLPLNTKMDFFFFFFATKQVIYGPTVLLHYLTKIPLVLYCIKCRFKVQESSKVKRPDYHTWIVRLPIKLLVHIWTSQAHKCTHSSIVCCPGKPRFLHATKHTDDLK